MSTVLVFGLLVFIGYELFIFNRYQTSQISESKREDGNAFAQNAKTADAPDIIGKSTFDVNAELKRMRQKKEVEERKEAIAKGEMTEDGKEIALPVNPEDCEVEPKKVWKQVPTEELNAIFDESEEPDEPHAEGATIDDIDLAFKNVRRKDMDEEEERNTVEVIKGLEGTVLFDTITKSFPGIGDAIEDLFSKYEGIQGADVDTDSKDKNEKTGKTFTIPGRFEDFNIHDYV